MMPGLLKRLLTVPKGVELTNLGVNDTPAEATRFKYTFFSDDGLSKGEVVLVHETNTYSCLSLTTFGSIPSISPDGVFWQETSGNVLIDFNVNFAEGDKVDSLKGTLTFLDWFSKEDKGRWIASVRSCGREVARTNGTWSRCTIVS
jgi:hypothetical protein